MSDRISDERRAELIEGAQSLLQELRRQQRAGYDSWDRFDLDRDRAKLLLEQSTEIESLRGTLAIVKPDHAASHYQCTKCLAKIVRWQDMEEYQHHGCGGLVRLIALNERDAVREQLVAMTKARDEACNNLQALLDAQERYSPAAVAASNEFKTMKREIDRRIAKLRKVGAK